LVLRTPALLLVTTRLRLAPLLVRSLLT